MTEQSLEDLFVDKEVEEVTEAEPEVKAEETAEEATETKGETEVSEDKTEETKAVEPPATNEQAGQMAALIEERRKRQAAEARLKELEGKEKESVPDPIESPEEYAQYIEAKSQSVNQTALRTMSRDVMMDLKEDYLQKEAVFMGLVADKEGNIIDQSLFDKFNASRNPARFAYDFAIEHEKIEALKSPDYEAKLREKILAELQEELKNPKLKATEVPDLTTAAAAGSNSQPVVKDLEMEDLFKDSPL